MDRSNGFADNWWGTFCRALRDFINAFDVNPLCLVAFLVINTMVMAYMHSIFDWFRVPDWWWGPTGVLFLIVGAILIKHTWGYTINSKYNSPIGVAPDVTDPAAPKTGQSGSACLSALLFLLLLSAMACAAFAETYYCVPKDGELFCKPVDFEHRTFEYDPPKMQQRGNILYYEKEKRSFRCYGKGEAYRCLPFDNGAVLLETPKTCPSPNPMQNWFSYTTIPTVDLGPFGGMGK